MIVADTYRARVDDVIADMERQFGVLTPALEPIIVDVLAGDRAAYRQLQVFGRTVAAPLIDQYGLAVAALAAGWYDTNRDLLKVPGAWGGAVVQDPNLDTGPMVGGVVADYVTVESVLAGLQAGMDLRVRQAGNGTVMDSILRDPRARGWGRVASAGCCAFCGLLAARGAVYRTQFTATFCPHEHCHCVAVPVWDGTQSEQLRTRADTIATRRSLTDRQRAAQNEQARSWIEQNKATLGLI